MKQGQCLTHSAQHAQTSNDYYIDRLQY